MGLVGNPGLPRIRISIESAILPCLVAGVMRNPILFVLLVFCLLHLNVRAGYKPIVETARLMVENHIESPSPQEIALKMARSYIRFTTMDKPDTGLVKKTWEIDSFEAMEAFFGEVEKNYPDPTNSAWTKAHNDMPKQFQGVQFTNTLDAKVADSLSSNQYVGIGIMLRQEHGYPVMAQVVENGPAHVAGAQPHDVMVKINGQDTRGMTAQHAVDALRGEKGTQVAIQLRRKGTVLPEKTFTRNIVPFKTVSWKKVGAANNYALLTLNGIKSSSVSEIRELLPELKQNKIKGIVISIALTRNEKLHDTILLANALMDGGEIGSVQTQDGIRVYHAEPESLFGQYPVVVIPTVNSDLANWLAQSVIRSKNTYSILPAINQQMIVNEHFAIEGTEYSVYLPTHRLKFIPPSFYKNKHYVMNKTIKNQNTVQVAVQIMEQGIASLGPSNETVEDRLRRQMTFLRDKENRRREEANRQQNPKQ